VLRVVILRRFLQKYRCNSGVEIYVSDKIPIKVKFDKILSKVQINLWLGTQASDKTRPK
jgi:hypothetical protein